MIYEASTLSVVVFFAFVGVTMALSFYLARRATSSQGYFAAHGEIPWFVNGIAFAGDYLSAASFLGICGMIAFYGYDGFLYSIGYLAGWIVALFVVAEPLKRLGKYTFADALDARFQSPGIKLAVGCSTLAVSIFYLIPQMVGAGALVTPLLGYQHHVGVIMVGATVIVIVVTAGMVSTTYVQFLKGSLLVLFSLVLTVIILSRGFHVQNGGADGHVFGRLGPLSLADAEAELLATVGEGASIVPAEGPWLNQPLLRVRRDDITRVWSITDVDAGLVELREAQTVTETADDQVWVNGQPLGLGEGETTLHPVGYITRLPGGKESSGPLNPLTFFSTLQESEVMLWSKSKTTIKEDNGDATTIYVQNPKSGKEILLPGTHPRFAGIKSDRLVDKLNFLSLMLALFCGTASLPHILIRYYTVKDESSARKSTIVGIAAIGLFYVSDALYGVGRHGQWDLGCDQFQHGRAAVGEEHRPLAVRRDFGHRFHHGVGNGQRLDSGLQRSGDLRCPQRILRRSIQREPADSPGPNRRRGRRRDRGGVGRDVQEDERQLPRGLGVQHRGVGQFAIADHVAVLEEDHPPRHHHGGRRGHGFVAGLDLAQRRHLPGRLWLGCGQFLGSFQPTRDRHDPARLSDTDRGVAGHLAESGLRGRPGLRCAAPWAGLGPSRWDLVSGPALVTQGCATLGWFGAVPLGLVSGPALVTQGCALHPGLVWGRPVGTAFWCFFAE